MIRQAHTYLVGAVSGTALIAAAVVAFVLLVSLQALREWPLAGIGGGDDSGVSSGQSLQGGAATGTAGVSTPPAGTTGNGRHSRLAGAGGEQQGGNVAQGASPSPSTGSPAGEAPSSIPATGGGAPPSTSASASGGAGNAGGGSGTAPPKGSGGSGSGQSTSGAVTGAVNNTVSGVDETLGGTLGETGVTKVTEEVVNGVAGPESPVGKTIDKTVEAVGGLLGGHH